MPLFVEVKRTQLNGSNGDGLGVAELMDMSQAVEEGAGFTPAANVAAAAVPFADLTAAANKVNEILTALKAAGLMVPDA